MSGTLKKHLNNPVTYHCGTYNSSKNICISCFPLSCLVVMKTVTWLLFIVHIFINSCSTGKLSLHNRFLPGE